ncbi:MAG: polysaccharide biosynthesis protein [Parvibaculum sp.]|uniref:polysaccharide biosynthesis protein n=1 Tax=Parvibaculum sp. TaxID=2024848 RepID=UPI0025D923A3|nr:nucleoside-diphosphate sugar epimerase/dehydratase [Parvibaculum sp.]MCE9649284.1 polysaccharide biosynthesis protein [Parvibaculum sp.]
MTIQRFRTPIIFVFDLALAMISLPLAVILRLGWTEFTSQYELVAQLTILFTAVAAVVLLRARLHRVAWRFISVNDALLIAGASISINLFFLVLMFFLTRVHGVPRAAVLINVFLLTTLMIGSRLLLRLWHESGLTHREDGIGRIPVLLIGASDEAEAFILTSTRDRQAPYRVVGVVDSGKRPVGGLVRGVSVLGEIHDLERTIELLASRHMRPENLIIADPQIRGKTLHHVVDIASKQSIKLNRLPSASELQGTGQQMQIKSVEVEDLLRREEAALDRLAMKNLVGGKRVLVTGAGGSIGSELVRQIAALGPAHLTLAEISEYNLYEIDRQLGDLFPAISRSALLLDVRDSTRIKFVFEKERPDIVFHTAALKHVPLLEEQFVQATLTNVKGTRNIADACVRHNVAVMVLISTDKAAHPISVMGATKRIAESYCQSLDVDPEMRGKTRFVTVRFGNVLGSAGSVVPLFQKQLAAGGPITVTHPEMTRYFMTIREAVELVLQAATLRDSEIGRGQIVVLDMGVPVNILNMARQMIKLAGLQPDKDIKIVFTGLRPGEKLSEILFQTDEEMAGTSYKDLMVAHPQIADRAFVVRIVTQLIEAALRHDEPAVMSLLEVAVADFAKRHAAAPVLLSEADVSAAQHSEI